jgi:hypothetical protein
LGDATVVSTHDQVLGGPSGQIFLGSTFPADAEYSREIKEAGQRVGRVLRERGALGRFAIDFISVRRGRVGSTPPSRSTSGRAAPRTPT